MASGIIGSKGSRAVRFDRDYPLGNEGGEFGGYSLFGGTSLNYTDYQNLTDKKK